MARRKRRRDPLRPMTMAELEAQANLLLEAGLSRPRSQIKRGQEEARRQAQEDATAIQNFATALANIAGQSRMGQEHVASAGRQGALSQGYATAQQLAEQQAADRANSILGAQGGTQRVQAGPLSQVTGYLGSVGASNLGVSGDALRNYAAGMPGAIGGRAQQQLFQRQSEGQKEQSKFRDQLEDLMAQSPGKLAEIMNMLQSRELQKEAARVQRDYLGVAQSRESFDQSFDVASLEAEIASDTANAAGKANKNKIKARKERVEALEAGKSDVLAFADEMAGRTKDIPGRGEVPDRPTWQRVYAQAWNRYGQQLMRYAPPGHKKWWKGQIEAMIVNALKGAGFTKTRGTGRG